MKVLVNQPISRDIVLVVSFSVALIIGSQVTIPFYPVPFTLQTLVLTLAVLYNSHIALKSVFLYMLLGVLGLPVFANWSNAAIAFCSPSVGYIVGMLVASAIISKIHIQNIMMKLVVLNTTVFGCGLLPLAYMMGVNDALHAGLIIFIIPEIIKTTIAYVIYNYIK